MYEIRITNITMNNNTIGGGIFVAVISGLIVVYLTQARPKSNIKQDEITNQTTTVNKTFGQTNNSKDSKESSGNSIQNSTINNSPDNNGKYSAENQNTVENTNNKSNTTTKEYHDYSGNSTPTIYNRNTAILKEQNKHVINTPENYHVSINYNQSQSLKEGYCYFYDYPCVYKVYYPDPYETIDLSSKYQQSQGGDVLNYAEYIWCEEDSHFYKLHRGESPLK